MPRQNDTVLLAFKDDNGVERRLECTQEQYALLLLRFSVRGWRDSIGCALCDEGDRRACGIPGRCTACRFPGNGERRCLETLKAIRAGANIVFSVGLFPSPLSPGEVRLLHNLRRGIRRAAVRGERIRADAAE